MDNEETWIKAKLQERLKPIGVSSDLPGPVFQRAKRRRLTAVLGSGALAAVVLVGGFFGSAALTDDSPEFLPAAKGQYCSPDEVEVTTEVDKPVGGGSGHPGIELTVRVEPKATGCETTLYVEMDDYPVLPPEGNGDELRRSSIYLKDENPCLTTEQLSGNLLYSGEHTVSIGTGCDPSGDWPHETQETFAFDGETHERTEDASADCVGKAETILDGEAQRVEMRVSPCSAEPGAEFTYVLKNTGDAELGYGPGFKLERATQSGWRWVNRKQGFRRPLFYLAPGEASEPEAIEVYINSPEPLALKPGLYRVSTSLQLTPGQMRPPTMTVKVEFEIGVGAEDEVADPSGGCEGTRFDLSKEPNYPVNSIHRWRTKEGCQVRLDVLMTRQGEEACGGPRVADILMGTPLGKTPERSRARIYVKDPENVFRDNETSRLYDPDAEVPQEAVDSGYRQDGAALWIVPGDDRLLYLVHEDRIEAWPLDKTPPGCA